MELGTNLFMKFDPNIKIVVLIWKSSVTECKEWFRLRNYNFLFRLIEILLYEILQENVPRYSSQENTCKSILAIHKETGGFMTSMLGEFGDAILAGSILTIWSMNAFLGGIFYEEETFCLFTLTKLISFFIFLNGNFFWKVRARGCDLNSAIWVVSVYISAVQWFGKAWGFSVDQTHHTFNVNLKIEWCFSQWNFIISWTNSWRIKETIASLEMQPAMR